MTQEALKLALEFIENSECGTADLEARIKEALAQHDSVQAKPEQEQEPVVWMYQDKSTHEVRFQKHMRDFVDHGATYETPLYTTPPQRKPLTDKQIGAILEDPNIAEKHQRNWLVLPYAYARAIEGAHGIKENT